MDKEQIKELGDKIQDKAEDVIDGIKDRLDGECCDHEDHEAVFIPSICWPRKQKKK